MRTLEDWITLLDTWNSIATVFHTEELRRRFTAEQLKQRVEATIEITTEAGRPTFFRIDLVAADNDDLLARIPAELGWMNLDSFTTWLLDETTTPDRTRD
jgi:hypothetical protein